MTRERRALTIFWLTVLLLTLGAFTAEALLRQTVCISAMLVTAETTVTVPIQCS